MTISAFDVGDKIRLGNQVGDNEDGTARSAFTDITGAAADPTAVSLELLLPDGTSAVYGYPTGVDGDMFREELGRFYKDVSLTQGGLWHWTLAGTGTVETAEHGMFYVRQSVT